MRKAASAQTVIPQRLATINDRALALVTAEVVGFGGAGIDVALVDAAVRGWSVNTRRVFRSDIALWRAWCRRRRIVASDAGPDTVAGWVRAAAGIDRSAAINCAWALILELRIVASRPRPISSR
jgi:hypothetical protein